MGQELGELPQRKIVENWRIHCTPSLTPILGFKIFHEYKNKQINIIYI